MTERAEAIAETLGDERRLGRVSSALANTLWITGDHAAAIAAATRALDIGVRLGDVATHATAVLRLGAIHYTTGEYDKAVVYLRQGVELTGGERLRERFGMAGSRRCSRATGSPGRSPSWGSSPKGWRWPRRAWTSTCRRTTWPASAPPTAAVGYVHLRRGELAEALAPLTRAVEVGQAAEVRNWESLSVGLLGLQRALTGHLAEGVALLERATGLAEQRGELFNLVLLKDWLGEAHLAAGDPERARRYAESSLEMARAQPQRGTEAWAWRLLGEIAAEADPPGVQEAETAYQRGADARVRPRHAPPRRPLPPRPRQALPEGRTRRAGAGRADHRGRDVPRDGDDVLVGAG